MEDQRRSRLALKLFRKTPLTKKAQATLPYPLGQAIGVVRRIENTTGRRDPFSDAPGRTGGINTLSRDGVTLKYAPGLSEKEKGLIDVTFRNEMDRKAQDRAAARKAGRPPRSAQGIAAAKEIQARVDAARKAGRPLRSAQGAGIRASEAGFSRSPAPATPATSTSQAQAFKVQGGQGYAQLARSINKKFGFKGDKRVSGRDLFKRMGGQILSAKRSYNFRQSDFDRAIGPLPSLAGAGGLGDKGIARSAALRKRLVAKGAFGKKPAPKPVVRPAPVVPKTPPLGPELTRKSFGPPAVRPPMPTPRANEALAAKRKSDMSAKGLGGKAGAPRFQMTAYRRDRSLKNRGVPVPAPLEGPRMMPK